MSLLTAYPRVADDSGERGVAYSTSMYRELPTLANVASALSTMLAIYYSFSLS
jgi:hypothetical protein